MDRIADGGGDLLGLVRPVKPPFESHWRQRWANRSLKNYSYNEAIAELQKVSQLSPGRRAFTANLAYAYAASRTRDEVVFRSILSRHLPQTTWPAGLPEMRQHKSCCEPSERRSGKSKSRLIRRFGARVEREGTYL